MLDRDARGQSQLGEAQLLSTLLKLIGAYRVYERWLRGQVTQGIMPNHVGVIVDGNRRWALRRSSPLPDGHLYGARTGEDFLEWCLDLGIKTVTVYTFSTENFRRSKDEVDAILGLIEQEAEKLGTDERIHKHRVHIKAIGRLDLLPESLQRTLRRIEEKTMDYDGHYLNLAVAYGGRAEIIDAARRISGDVKQGRLDESTISEELFDKYLYTAHLPNPHPDMIIRTSGEERLSGFLLWQSAYSEFVFLDVYWPEFRRIDLLRAIRTYQNRRRKFGR